MIAFALALAGLVFLVLALLDRGSADAPGVSVRSAATGPDGSLVQANTEGLIPLQSKDEDSYINSIAELHTRFGEPPDATFGRMRISAADIDAPLSVRHVGEDGHMLNPSGPDDITYYDFSGWTGLGGFPTNGGNAVFAGHVDMAAHLPYANLDYLGPGVFFKLHEIEKGDTIELDLGNGPVTYRVRWVREVSVVEGDWDSVLSSDVEVDSITLITCGGDFEGGSYTHRTVVRAERA